MEELVERGSDRVDAWTAGGEAGEMEEKSWRWESRREFLSVTGLARRQRKRVAWQPIRRRAKESDQVARAKPGATAQNLGSGNVHGSRGAPSES